MTTIGKGLAIMAVVGLVGCGGAARSEPRSGLDASHRGSDHAEVGRAAPDLSIPSVNGKGRVSLEGARGKILVVDFWATWCGPCRSSFPQLEALSKKAGDKVVVVGISVDDEPSEIAGFVKETGVTFPIGWDEGHAIAERWAVKNMPTTFIVDGGGKVRFIHGGYHDGEAAIMEKELAALADESASATRTAVADGRRPEGRTEIVAAATSDRSGDSVKAEATATATPPTKKARPRAKPKGGGKARPAKKATKHAASEPVLRPDTEEVG